MIFAKLVNPSARTAIALSSKWLRFSLCVIEQDGLEQQGSQVNWRQLESENVANDYSMFTRARAKLKVTLTRRGWCRVSVKHLLSGTLRR